MRDINYSNAQSNNFLVVIETMESVQLKLFDVQMPMFSANSTVVPTDGDRQIRIPGTHMEIDQLQINFFVDEFWSNYIECYKWMKNCINSPEPFLHTKSIAILPLNSSKQPTGVAFVFSDCHCINLAPIPLDSEGETTDVVMGMTIDFSDMELEQWFDENGNTRISFSND